MPEPPRKLAATATGKSEVPLEPENIPSQMLSTSSAIVNRLIFPVCLNVVTTDQSWRNVVPVIGGNDEDLNGRSTHGCQARGVLFPLGAATTVTPAWIVLLGAVTTVTPAKIGRLQVSAAPPIQKVS